MRLAFWKKSKRAALLALPGEPAKVLCDLDRLVSTPVCFIWGGNKHFIKPMTNEIFLAVLADLARVYAIQKSNLKADDGTMLKVYAKLFMDVCDTITYDDIASMEPAQVTVLFAGIMDVVKGKAKPDEQVSAQKKTSEKTA